MEPQDLELIEKLVPHHEELKHLVEEHESLERRLEEYHRRIHLTPSEELEKKRLQKQKLAGKDRIEQILSRHRKSG